MECKVGGFFPYCKAFTNNTLIKVIGAWNIPEDITDGKANKVVPVFVVFVSILVVFVGDVTIGIPIEPVCK